MERRAKEGIEPIPAAPIVASVGQGAVNSLETANAKLLLLRGEGEPEPERRSAGWFAPINARLADGINGDEETAADEPTVTAEPKIRVSPSLNNKVSEAEWTAEYRIWLLLRHLDTKGTGAINAKYARKQITKTFGLFSKRRYNQLIRAGLDIFWHRGNDGQLWIHGMTAVCDWFDVAYLRGKNVMIPLSRVTSTLKLFRATLQSAFHAGRKNADPISRETIRTITGTCERTQQEYDQLSGVTATPNYGIGELQTDDNVEEHFYQFGYASFTFVDHHGKRGKEGARYNARQLPNTYQSPLTAGCMGRKKKINKSLNRINGTPCEHGARGQSNNPCQRIFFDDARKACKRSMGDDIIWRDKNTKRYGIFVVWNQAVLRASV